MAAYQRDWLGICKWVPLGQLASYEWSILAVGLIAGCAWAFFLGHLGEWPSLFSGTGLLCAVALALGILSTTPTLCLVVIEEDIFHFVRGGEPINVFFYNIGGVGLREELCKLLLFLPLLPFLIRRGDELEALIVACFVGLGFAVEENAGYFMNSDATNVAGRFLSANFFHIALTGMNGLALFRAFRRDRGGLNDFLFVFPVTVLAHGIYDALLGLPHSDISGYLPMTVYIAFSMFFFNRVSQLRSNVRQTIGLTGAFVFAISVVIGTVVIYQMINLGVHAGLLSVGSEILGSAALVFMFFREFNEQLSP
jgi:RsiW-degrading membrane proteinase PrsW (M82 family)